MHKLALAIVLTSQGISFLHAGTEFLRSKRGVENSFESSDSVNAIDWSLKTTNKDVFDYVKSLIKMRKTHPAFRMKTAKQVVAGIRFINKVPPQVVAYFISGTAVGDSWKKIIVIYNGAPVEQAIPLSAGKWMLFTGDNNEKQTLNGKVLAQARSCTILYQL